ncbi:hypothetical protein GCM10027085_33600 [Spirosoma aerophilum]
MAGFGLMAARTSDIMSDLHIEAPKLQQDIILNLKEPRWFFFNPTASMRQLAKRVPESSRATTVAALGHSVRTFVESSAFRQAWLQDVRYRYPYDDTYSEEKQAQKARDGQATKAAMNQQLAAMDQAFAQMDPTMLQMAMRSQIAQQEQQLASETGSEKARLTQQIAALKKIVALPPAESKKQYLAYLKQQANGELNKSVDEEVDPEKLAQYRRQRADFDAHADFKPLLKQRLKDFITLTETIDFQARLVPMGYKQEFANPVYQRKPAEWKFLYRLGKEPVMEARSFAQKWLVDLN